MLNLCSFGGLQARRTRGACYALVKTGSCLSQVASVSPWRRQGAGGAGEERLSAECGKPLLLPRGSTIPTLLLLHSLILFLLTPQGLVDEAGRSITAEVAHDLRMRLA